MKLLEEKDFFKYCVAVLNRAWFKKPMFFIMGKGSIGKPSPQQCLSKEVDSEAEMGILK